MIHTVIKGIMSRRKMVAGIMLVLAVFGLNAYLNLPRESSPNIPVPFITVHVPLPGVSPEDSERLIVRPLETQLKAIDGLKEMQGFAMQGAGMIFLEFEIDFEPDSVLNDVRAKVDIARARFPAEALEPVIEEYNVNQDPVLTVVLAGDAPERTLYRTAKTLQQKLEGVEGVFEVKLYGGREEVMEVIIDPVKLEDYNVSTSQLFQVIRNNNALVPAGNLITDGGKFAVKVPGVIEDVEDVMALPVRSDGAEVVTFGDIAEVRRTFLEPGSITRFNDKPAFSLDISKRAGANILETVALVRAAVEEDQSRWPDTIRVQYTYDESEFISDTLSLLQSGLIIAVILVMIVIVASLGVRSGLLIGVGVPTSFLMAFLLMQATGVTINIMVMFGLVLAVGILVDGGIVVVEYADRKMAEGLDKRAAYTAASARMFWPVLNGTLTTLCAFLPFLFWDSIAGKFMSYLPITLFFVLGSALVVALIFTPVLGSYFGKSEVDDEERLALATSDTGDPMELRGIMGRYARVVRWATQNPGKILLITLGTAIAVVVWFASTPHSTKFFLEEDPERATVYVQARGNLSIYAMDELAQIVEDRLQNIDGVESTYARVSRVNAFGQGGPPNDNIARITLDFLPFEDRPMRGVDIVEDIRERVKDLPGLKVEVRTPEGGPPQGKDIQVQLTSWNNTDLDAAAAMVRNRLEQTPGLIEIGDSLPLPGIDWDIQLDREEAGKYGADVSTVGAAIQLVTNGILVGRYRPDDTDEEVDIRVRYPPEMRSVTALDQLKINTQYGQVPIGFFVDRVPAQQVDSIKRLNAERFVTVDANAAEGVAANLKIDELKTWLETDPLPKTVKWKFRGGDEESQAAAQFFMAAMAIALFLMSIILMWQFNSYYSVFLTLLAVVLSTIGVLLGIQLNVAGTFNYVSIIMCGTGIVALAGVVVNHNIVLIDTYHQLRGEGFAQPDAAVRAACQRIRPVLLTTFTTMVGLFPLMFQIEPDFFTGKVTYAPPGSEWWVQLAGAVIWGLSFSTFLTLLITPSFLAAPHTIRTRRAERKARRQAMRQQGIFDRFKTLFSKQRA